MTRTAAARGSAGTVIHGTCRDVASILDVGCPMWSAARFMRTGKDRVRLKAVQVPLVVDGVTITPGDWVCADEDGALVVPADRAHEVVHAAQRIERTEQAITDAVLDHDELRALNFPVFSPNNSIVGTRKHYRGIHGQPILLGGVTLATGDLVVGDADGVVAIPQADIDRVLTAADARAAQENDFFAQLRSGATTVNLYDLPPA
jgi:regulator of RNase E activity RraA